MTQWGQLGFQDANSPLMAQLIFFHDHSIFILTIIMALVMYITILQMTNKFSSLMITESQIETI